MGMLMGLTRRGQKERAEVRGKKLRQTRRILNWHNRFIFNFSTSASKLVEQETTDLGGGEPRHIDFLRPLILQGRDNM